MCIYRTTILMPKLRNFIGLSSLNCAHAQHFPANEMCCCLSPLDLCADFISGSGTEAGAGELCSGQGTGAVMHNFTFPEHCLRHPSPAQPSS